MEIQSQHLDDLTTRLCAERRVWVQLALNRPQDDWQLSLLEVTLREPPPMWTRQSWLYERASFNAVTPARLASHSRAGSRRELARSPPRLRFAGSTGPGPRLGSPRGCRDGGRSRNGGGGADRRSEGASTEFKRELPPNDRNLIVKVMKTVAAFANTSGGTLLLGIDNDGIIRGLSVDDAHATIDRMTS